MLTIISKAAVWMLALAAAPTPAAGLADSRLPERVEAVLDEWVQSERIVGAVVLIARDGEIVYRRAAGYADREGRLPVTERTVFRLASMSKLIVSATALALVERGVLALADPVDKWLPEFTPAMPDGSRPVITVRHLMTHTSGLTYAFQQGAQSTYRRYGVSAGLDQPGLSMATNLRRLAAVPLRYAPGTDWEYSIATDVLGAVIERAAGLPLPVAVERYVTGPLGMTDTTFDVPDPQRLAIPYKDGDRKAIRMNPLLDSIPLGPGIPFSPRRAFDPDSFPSGGAGMNGTAGDYLLLLEAIRRGGAPILSGKSAALLTEHAIGELRAESEGPGWGFSLAAAVLLDPALAGTPQLAGTWQWGGVLGSHWFVDPEARLTVVVLTNTAIAGVIGEFPAALRKAIYRD